MTWKPYSEVEIWDEINSSWRRMTPPQRNLWEVIRIDPQKWAEREYGQEGGGFWVVAILGNTVVWYNDIEEGFNRSTYSKFGEIDQYWCNQDQLEWTVQNLLEEIRDGYPSGGNCGPPIPLE